MASYSTNEFRSGLKVLLDGQPCSILENEFVKPGKGQAFNRVKLRNLLTGRVLEKTFKSGETIQAADVLELELQYLYNDGEHWHFMNNSSYEQHIAPESTMVDAAKWIKEEDLCLVTLYNGEVLTVQAPNFVMVKVTETEPGVKGDTATGGSKNATVETGATVRVPLFIEEGEVLKIDTRTGEYVSRAK